MISLARKAKINWQCRRGMLELDIIFQRFIKQSIDQLNEQQIVAVEALLNCPDPDLYAWLMGYEEPTEKEFLEIVSFIRLHDNI